MWGTAAVCETSVSKIRHYNRLSSCVPSARSCRIAPITPHCECGVTEMACFQHAFELEPYLLNEISDTNIILYCNVLIFLFAFIVALYLPANFLEQTSYFAASLDQPLLDHLLLHFRTIENLVLASF